MKLFVVSAKFALFVVLLCGVAYPVLMTGVAQVLFQKMANGSLVVQNGVPIASSLIGQNFARKDEFHSRPSATPDPGGNGSVPYDAAFSSPSNLGPTNKSYLSGLKTTVDQYRADNLLSPNEKVPADAVTASGSGLDPDISLDNALYQARRIAAERKIPLETLQKMVRQLATPPQLGFLGPWRVNVVELNLALDRFPRPVAPTPGG
jgi:K+-transporting ATPase ATPase C chain